MPSASQILDAFKKAESRERIELMVEMFRYLTPTEMRFVLTYLEDLAANSLRTYQRVESEANDCKRLSSLTRPEATLDEIIGQAVLFTSFLRKDNINGARLMTRILEEVMRRVERMSCVPNGELGTKNADPELPLIGDVLLLFSMASHHSAFSFNSRFELHTHLKRLQRMFNQPEERLCSEQSLTGFSRFPSLESVEVWRCSDM